MKQISIFAAIAAVTLAACASTSTAAWTASTWTAAHVSTDKSAILGIDWYLMEIRNGNTVINLNRPKLEAEGNGDVYRIRFDEKKRDDGKELVFGKAAPNTYSGPCKWGGGSNLSFGAMASTMMFAFKEPEALKEHDYYAYLTRVKWWGLTDAGRLELFCEDKSGQAVMVFAKRQAGG